MEDHVYLVFNQVCGYNDILGIYTRISKAYEAAIKELGWEFNIDECDKIEKHLDNVSKHADCVNLEIGNSKIITKNWIYISKRKLDPDKKEVEQWAAYEVEDEFFS